MASLTRRGFLTTFGTSAAAATVLQFPISRPVLAASQRATRSGSSPIRLNSNENAYGPSPRTMAALRDALSEAHRYPDDSRREFKERVAQLHRVTPEQVLIGCGSVEVLRIAALVFTSPGRKLGMASSTFEEMAPLS